MSKKITSSFVSLLAVLIVLAASASAQTISNALVASGLSRPVYVTAPAGDPSRIFVLEQWEARIRIVKNGVLLATPFLDLPTTTVINSGNERGLLGMAFHPNYWANGYFYLNYNNTSGHTVIARYQVTANPDVANPASVQVLAMSGAGLGYSFTQPFSNHNGGWIGFGPDGYLYIAAGDGGSGGDPQGNGQNLNTLLGKMLRVDVNNPNTPFYFNPPTNPFFGAIAGRDEIWAYGLRNPFRCSFDRVTGELWIGDVGQNAREEIDYQPAFDPLNPTVTAGKNYGWNCREGIANYLGCTPPNYVGPIYDYPQGSGTSQGFCVIGGYVYRGCAIPGLEGTYFFGDYQTSRLWSFRRSGLTTTGFIDRTASIGAGISGPASFGEDAFGEIYICSHSTGAVYKIVPAAGNTAGATVAVVGTPLIGTTITYNLSSPQNANQGFIFGLSGGFSPGILLSDLRVIPLNFDPFLTFFLDPLNPLLTGNYGTLSPTGTASLTLTIPNSAVIIGLQLSGAFVVPNPASPAGIAKISCPRVITIQ